MPNLPNMPVIRINMVLNWLNLSSKWLWKTKFNFTMGIVAFLFCDLGCVWPYARPSTKTMEANKTNTSFQIVQWKMPMYFFWLETVVYISLVTPSQRFSGIWCSHKTYIKIMINNGANDANYAIWLRLHFLHRLDAFVGKNLAFLPDIEHVEKDAHVLAHEYFSKRSLSTKQKRPPSTYHFKCHQPLA